MTVVRVAVIPEPLHVADLAQMNIKRSSKHDANTLAIQMELLQCKSGTGSNNNLTELKMDSRQSLSDLRAISIRNMLLKRGTERR